MAIRPRGSRLPRRGSGARVRRPRAAAPSRTPANSPASSRAASDRTIVSTCAASLIGCRARSSGTMLGQISTCKTNGRVAPMDVASNGHTRLTSDRRGANRNCGHARNAEQGLAADAAHCVELPDGLHEAPARAQPAIRLAVLLCANGACGFPETAASDKWRLRHPDEATALPGRPLRR